MMRCRLLIFPESDVPGGPNHDEVCEVEYRLISMVWHLYRWRATWRANPSEPNRRTQGVWWHTLNYWCGSQGIRPPNRFRVPPKETARLLVNMIGVEDQENGL